MVAKCRARAFLSPAPFDKRGANVPLWMQIRAGLPMCTLSVGVVSKTLHVFFLGYCILSTLSLNVCRRDLCADNFDSIYKKYMQYFYLQINLLKN